MVLLNPPKTRWTWREYQMTGWTRCGGVLSVFLMTCLTISGGRAYAETFVAPGDVGTIEYPLQNSSISDAVLQDATLEYQAPAHFIVKTASIRGPHSIPPAETFSFIVEYEIAAGAPEGPLEIILQPRSPSSSDEEVEVAPALTTLDTSVSFDIADPLFLVENEKLTLSGSAGKTRENSGLPEFYHRV